MQNNEIFTDLEDVHKILPDLVPLDLEIVAMSDRGAADTTTNEDGFRRNQRNSTADTSVPRTCIDRVTAEDHGIII